MKRNKLDNEESNVLTTFGYDPEKISGLAFGWGITRMASQWLGIKRIKNLYQQDLRLLQAVYRRGV